MNDQKMPQQPHIIIDRVKNGSEGVHVLVEFPPAGCESGQIMDFGSLAVLIKMQGWRDQSRALRAYAFRWNVPIDFIELTSQVLGVRLDNPEGGEL